MSQSRVARLVGVDHSYISRLLDGARSPSRGMVIDLATALELPRADRYQLLMAAGFMPVMNDRTERVILAVLDAMDEAPRTVRMDGRAA